jgi:hypothetical protein
MTDTELERVRDIIRFELAHTNSCEYVKTSRVTYKAAQLFGPERCRDLRDQILDEIEKAQREREVWAMEQLRLHLGALPKGDVPEEDVPKIAHLLAIVWITLNGSEEESTHFSKLRRAEKFSWKSPILKFVLERHAGINRGFKRAPTHHWEVNLDAASAHIGRSGTRTRAQTTWSPKDYDYSYTDTDLLAGRRTETSE